MDSALQKLVLLLILSAAFVGEAGAATIYGGVDAGSSFSPHGVGVVAGGSIWRLGAEAGYGFVSKNQQAGNPLSLAIHFDVLSSLSIFGGISRYKGSGKRTVVYENNLETHDLEAEWDITYQQFGLRLLLTTDGAPGKGPGWLLTGSAGVGAIRSADIDAEQDYDMSNLGRPVGLRVEDTQYTHGVMGPGDWGPFLSAGVIYAFQR